jgi:membrane protease YdiL (CAAX protease family)
MNHLEASFSGRNTLWRYGLMILLIFAATNTLGSLPFLIVSLIKSSPDPDTLSKISSDPNFLTNMGINENLLLVLLLFPFNIGLVAFAFLVKPLHSRNFMGIISGNGKIRWRHFFASGSVWMILMVIYLFVYVGIDPSNFTVNNKSSSLIVLSLISFLLIPFQAAFEEVIFRGYLMQGFGLLVRNRLFPLAATSVLFALMHSLNPEVKEFGFLSVMPQYLTFGLIFGIITILDDGIEAALGAHAANNIFLCIMVTNESSALQTQALYEQHNYHPWIEWGGLFVSGIILVLILKKIFGWESYSVLYSKIESEKPLVQTP